MDEKRVALAGNNYEMSAFSEEYELNDPEFATPLGIAVSAGLGLISDSYRIMLNDQPAKLFRSGTLTVLDLLMMNGYNSADLVGRTGKSLSVTVDGQRMTFRGQSATPCVLRLNGQEAAPSALVYAGDCIEFIPAVQGDSAARTVRELLGMDFPGGVLVNGKPVGMEYVLSSGDQIVTTEEPLVMPEPEPEPEPLETPELEEPEESREPVEEAAEWAADEEEAPGLSEPVVSAVQESPVPAGNRSRPLYVYLNGSALILPGKPDGAPYYLMDLLDRSGIDFETLNCPVELLVNGEAGAFSQELKNNDQVIIRRQTLPDQ